MSPVFIGPPVAMTVQDALEIIRLFIAGKASAVEALNALCYVQKWYNEKGNEK